MQLGGWDARDDSPALWHSAFQTVVEHEVGQAYLCGFSTRLQDIIYLFEIRHVNHLSPVNTMLTGDPEEHALWRLSGRLDSPSPSEIQTSSRPISLRQDFETYISRFCFAFEAMNETCYTAPGRSLDGVWPRMRSAGSARRALDWAAGYECQSIHDTAPV